ncbi:RadC family protein [Syntrophomonas erecta]
MSQYYMGIKDLPEDMRPREKLLLKGEVFLNDDELLAIILGQGMAGLNALDMASSMLARYGSLRSLKEASIEELTKEPGIGTAKAVSIKAAIELGRRISINTQRRISVRSPEDVKSLVMEDMRYYDREHFRVLYLDRKGGLITIEDISVGGLHSSIVHPREVFKPAVKRSAASLILVHNHPSGDPAPSQEDIEVTRRLMEAGHILGMEVLDHVIIGEGTYCSLKSRNLI